MKRFEVVGNETETMCRLLGERFTLGAAKKLANELMHEEARKRFPRFYSIDVDDGKGTVLYTVTPDIVLVPLAEACA